ncbi:MAG TPA: hypothetical protein VJ783_26880 [Pirellulales bacterium]|nr:hypothetical protein [Pirellulales bacterium]
MRPDMAKVIVERPRGGMRLKTPKGSRKRLQRLPINDWPKSEGIGRPWSGSGKWLNEHLGPLRRYLQKQVGRPWNKVFAEISEHIRLDSAVQSHVLDHLADFVEIHVCLVDGQPVATGGRWRGRPLAPPMLYVCPRTGLLRAARRKRRVRMKNRVTATKWLQYHRIAGVWYEVALRPIPRDRARCWDAVLNKCVAHLRAGEATSAYGFAAYALSKRPLADRELMTLRRRLS